MNTLNWMCFKKIGFAGEKSSNCQHDFFGINVNNVSLAYQVMLAQLFRLLIAG